MLLHAPGAQSCLACRGDGVPIQLRCMCNAPTLPAAQVADFGLSRVLEDNMTHVSTNLYGARMLRSGTPPCAAHSYVARRADHACMAPVRLSSVATCCCGRPQQPSPARPRRSGATEGRGPAMTLFEAEEEGLFWRARRHRRVHEPAGAAEGARQQGGRRVQLRHARAGAVDGRHHLPRHHVPPGAPQFWLPGPPRAASPAAFALQLPLLMPHGRAHAPVRHRLPAWSWLARPCPGACWTCMHADSGTACSWAMHAAPLPLAAPDRPPLVEGVMRTAAPANPL